MENFIAINFHKTRDFSAKMSATFEFVRQNFKSLGTGILFIAGPPVLVACMMMGSFFSDIFTASLSAATNPGLMQDLFMTTNFWTQLGLAAMFIIVSSVASIATINNYVLLYEAKQTNRINVSEIWESVRSTFWMYLGTFFALILIGIALYFVVVLLVVGVASISPLLAIPAGIAVFCGFFYALIGLSLIFIIRAYERKSFFEALTRSFKLVQGKWWSTFGLIFVLYLVAIVTSYIFLIPGYVLMGITALHNVSPSETDKPAEGVQIAMVVFFTLYYMVQMLLYALPNLGIAFQYFNLVERKEARGLMSQIESIGQAPTEPTAQDEHY